MYRFLNSHEPKIFVLDNKINLLGNFEVAFFYTPRVLWPASHMSPTISGLLSVTVETENLQKIFCIDSFEQS